MKTSVRANTQSRRDCLKPALAGGHRGLAPRPTTMHLPRSTESKAISLVKKRMWRPMPKWISCSIEQRSAACQRRNWTRNFDSSKAKLPLSETDLERGNLPESTRMRRPPTRSHAFESSPRSASIADGAANPRRVDNVTRHPQRLPPVAIGIASLSSDGESKLTLPGEGDPA